MKLKQHAKTAIAAGILAIPALTVLPNAASAATETANINVTAQVNHSCVFAAASVDMPFGDLGDLSQVQNRIVNLQVGCTNGLPYELGFDLGANASGTQRRMKFNTEYVSYELYDATAPLGSPELGMAWGNNTIAGTGAGLSTINYNTHILEGIVPPQAAPAAGNYTDTILVTMQY